MIANWLVYFPYINHIHFHSIFLTESSTIPLQWLCAPPGPPLLYAHLLFRIMYAQRHNLQKGLGAGEYGSARCGDYQIHKVSEPVTSLVPQLWHSYASQLNVITMSQQSFASVKVWMVHDMNTHHLKSAPKDRWSIRYLMIIIQKWKIMKWLVALGTTGGASGRPASAYLSHLIHGHIVQ